MADAYPTDVDTWAGVFLLMGFVPLWALIIGTVIPVFRRPSRRTCHPNRSPEECRLFRAFARGKIGDDEYRSRLEALRGLPGGTDGRPLNGLPVNGGAANERTDGGRVSRAIR